MDQTTLLPFPTASTEPVARDLVEIDAAIDLVAHGLATRVRLVGLMRPEAVAAIGLARAQDALVGFSLDRGPTGIVAITVGPRI
jgi:hypothetical protein